MAKASASWQSVSFSKFGWMARKLLTYTAAMRSANRNFSSFHTRSIQRQDLAIGGFTIKMTFVSPKLLVQLCFRRFFSEIRGFIVKNWLYIYDSKYCPSLVTTFSHLSGSVRIPSKKLVIFWGYPRIDPIFYFFIRPEVLVSQAVCHWSKQVIVRGSNIWRIRRVG